MSLRRTRLLKEVSLLKSFQHEGVKVPCLEEIENEPNTLDILNVEIIGPSSTPFSNQILHLEIKPTDRYPIEPPIVRFKSHLRHPNVDEVSGRICLDLLRMPPEGSWRPNISFGSLIVSIMVLLSAPNLDDPVRPDLILEWTRTNEAETEVNSPIVLCNAVKKPPPSLSLASLPKRLKKE